jgi:imidazolonepropionase-like amidohydrolase
MPRLAVPHLALALGLLLGADASAQVVIRGALVVDGTGGPPKQARILVRDARIAALDDGEPEPLGAQVIDAQGMTALPGLIDAHVHFVAASGTSIREDSDEDLEELNRAHLRAYLACGVTTVLDAGVYPAVAQGIQRWLADGAPGPRYLTTGPYLRPRGGYGHPRFGAESTPEDVERKLDRIQSLGAVGVKLGLEDGFGPGVGPRPFSPELLEAVVAGARRRGLPLYVHARTESTQRAALRIGAHALLHAAMDATSPEPLSDAFVAEMRASGAYQVTTLSVVETFPGLYDTQRLDDPLVRLVVPARELETARAPDARDRFFVGIIGWAAPWTFERTRPWIARVALSPERLARTLAVGQENLLRLHRAGVPLVVGTDAPSPWPDAIYHFHGVQTAREIELLGEAGLSPVEAIAAATGVSARMLGLEDEIGTLEVGKRADVLLVEGDASRDLRALRRPRWILKDGVAHTPEEWMQGGREVAADRYVE